MTTQRKRNNKFSRTILIAAVITAMLSVTALAVSGVGGWFLNFFREQSGKELTPGQQQFVEDGTVGIGQSVKRDGLTVTVESALSDDYTAYIKLNIEAPEGTLLDGSNYFFKDFSLYRPSDPDGKQYRSFIQTAGASWSLLEDEDGNSNTASILLIRSVAMAPGSGFSFRDGVARRLELESFCTSADDGTDVVLFEGDWSFEFLFADNGGSIEFISELVHCQGQRMTGAYEDVWMTSFELSAMGATCTYEFFDDGGTPEALDFIGAEVVMKDGSVMALRPGRAGIGNFTFKMDAPIALDEVDFIRLPGDVTLPIG